eukprot:m.488112 g.488112  ORF g.488112 m.488112 type:complete len:639 (+) comp25549_c0_seq1:76-1992(+)
MAPSSCLVTGGCGFFGTALVKTLVARGWQVRVLDLKKSTCPGIAAGITGDLCDYDTVLKAVRGVSVVFHTASVVDLAAFPSPVMRKINVEGTKHVIRACVEAGVPSLVYTSSIDVVYDGVPITNGDETWPYPEHPMTGYIATKGEAEQLVREANSDTLATACIRPAHIYGPGDIMITEVLGAVQAGEVPVAFACGQNDYVFVDNLAHAHELCGKAVAQRDTRVVGEVFFVNDYHDGMWDHMAPYLEAAGLAAPATRIPVSIVLGYATVLDMLCRASFLLTGIKPKTAVTRYSILAVSRDFYFDGLRAREVLGYTPPTSRAEACKTTANWVKSLVAPAGDGSTSGTTPPRPATIPRTAYGLAEKPGRPFTPRERLQAIHLAYGLCLLFIGTLSFFFPERLSFLMGIPTPQRPAPTAVLAQTNALIVGVLGSYSVVSSLCDWGPVFYTVVACAQLLTGIMTLALYGNGSIPAAFAIFGASQFAISLTTLSLCKAIPLGTNPWRISFNALTAAQLAHGILSTAFTGTMMFAPAVALPVVLPGLVEPAPAGAVAWGHMLGVTEIVMSVTYPGSGLLPALRPFAVLSVYSRLGCLALLGFGALAGVSGATQFYGCLGDGVLALLTLAALRATYIAPQAKAKRD